MLKYSKNCEGAEDLQMALTSILGILKAVNDSMHQIAITGYEVTDNTSLFIEFACCPMPISPQGDWVPYNIKIKP